MQGKIMKGIAGFYYVYTKQGLVECKARGIFRKEQIKPLVGDLVEVEITEDTEAAPEMPAEILWKFFQEAMSWCVRQWRMWIRLL